jgi:hypothetical protein
MVHDYRAVYPTTLYPVVSINQIGIIHKFVCIHTEGITECVKIRIIFQIIMFYFYRVFLSRF